MALFDIIIFIISWILLFISSRWLVKALARVARFLGWKEFVISFFIVAVVGSTPNFFIGLFSAFQKVPQLSLGDVLGGNLIDLTLVIALATIFAAKGLPAKSRTVQTTSFITMFAAILPVFLISDGVLGRIDGIVLISMFVIYLLWVFSKKERFAMLYPRNDTLEKEINNEKTHIRHSPFGEIELFIRNVGKAAAGAFLMVIAALGVVKSSLSIVHIFDIYPIIFGTMIVSLGDCLPETFFTIDAARENRTWMILGDLMGSVIVASTLVLGTVAIICPIAIPSISYFSVARLFLIVASLLFLFFIRTGRKITKKEASILLFLYIFFIITAALLK